MKHARKDYQRIQDTENLIPENEPVFLLRGKDVCAPVAVRAWAEAAKKVVSNSNIIEAALRQADEMEKWQRDVEKKIPDMPVE